MPPPILVISDNLVYIKTATETNDISKKNIEKVKIKAENVKKISFKP